MGDGQQQQQRRARRRLGSHHPSNSNNGGAGVWDRNTRLQAIHHQPELRRWISPRPSPNSQGSQSSHHFLVRTPERQVRARLPSPLACRRLAHTCQFRRRPGHRPIMPCTSPQLLDLRCDPPCASNTPTRLIEPGASAALSQSEPVMPCQQQPARCPLQLMTTVPIARVRDTHGLPTQ